jgi:hypothetical protein
MSGLENIVRPFQTGDVSPPKRYVTAGTQGVPNVLLQIGRTGQGRTFNGSYNITVTSYMARAIVEKRSSGVRPFG